MADAFLDVLGVGGVYRILLEESIVAAIARPFTGFTIDFADDFRLSRANLPLCLSHVSLRVVIQWVFLDLFSTGNY